MASSLEENCLGWAANDESGFLSPYKFARRSVGTDDVSIRITHCGVCYADVIWTRNQFGDSMYPLVPGHEIVGIVQNVGSSVRHLKTGDHVGVGTYVNACQECEHCESGLEYYCTKVVRTYNGVDLDGSITKGGFSNYIVVNQRCCHQIPENYPMELAAPLLCAGITVYSPMKRYGMLNQPGKSLGVIGLGGLGHMAVKFGKAFGLHVSVFSTSLSKKDEALNLLGADSFVLAPSDDQKFKEELKNSLDFIIDTASGNHPVDPYMMLLKVQGVLVMVGAQTEVKLNPLPLVLGMKTLAGSTLGGIKDTQEMLHVCAAKKIYPKVEVVPIQYANQAIQRLINKDVKYRFVINIQDSLNSN